MSDRLTKQKVQERLKVTGERLGELLGAMDWSGIKIFTPLEIETLSTINGYVEKDNTPLEELKARFERENPNKIVYTLNDVVKKAGGGKIPVDERVAYDLVLATGIEPKPSYTREEMESIERSISLFRETGDIARVARENNVRILSAEQLAEAERVIENLDNIADVGARRIIEGVVGNLRFQYEVYLRVFEEMIVARLEGLMQDPDRFTAIAVERLNESVEGSDNLGKLSNPLLTAWNRRKHLQGANLLPPSGG